MGAAVNKDDGNEGMLTAARAYTRRGWRVVQYGQGEKVWRLSGGRRCGWRRATCPEVVSGRGGQ